MSDTRFMAYSKMNIGELKERLFNKGWKRKDIETVTNTNEIKRMRDKGIIMRRKKQILLAILMK